MLRLRTGTLAVAAVLATACTKSQPPPATVGAGGASTGPIAPRGAVVLGTFRGLADPSTGTISIGPVQAPGSSDELLPAALTVFEPVQDGTPGSGPANTFELVTEDATGGPLQPAFVPDGCTTGTDSYEGSITLRSFYTTKTFWNVYVELTNVNPLSRSGCNSDATFGGLSRGFGLWRYGTIAPSGGAGGVADHNTVRWKFSASTGQSFTFTGRIMAMPGPEFDWTPAAMTAPTRKFADVETTTAHLRWNGSGFTDLLGKGTTFAGNGTVWDATSGLMNPADHYVTFASGYLTTTLTATQLDTSGDFTICAKIKPGAHPANGTSKVLVARGKPTGAGAPGWVLMQDSGNYVFQYVLNGGAVIPAILSPGWYDNNASPPWKTTTPQDWAYDYLCGGRSGTTVMVGDHGKWVAVGASQLDSASAQATDAALQLSIGAYPDGTAPATDAGVYEVIFDSRAPSEAVLTEIVTAAEARALPNSVALSGSLRPRNSDPTSVTGSDGFIYQLPPYATLTLPTDGYGAVVPAPFPLEYTYPVVEDTTSSGYCVGAEVAAIGDWVAEATSILPGGVLQFGTVNNYGTLALSGDSRGAGYTFYLTGSKQVHGFVAGSTGWAAGTAHKFLACVDPIATAVPKFYVDGALQTPAGTDPGTAPFNVGALDQTLAIGGTVHGNATFIYGQDLSPIAGARIHRVVLCPSNDPLLCQY